MSKDLFENVQKDDNLDLSSLMVSSSETTPVKKKVSPLEQMKQEKETETKGLKVSNEELEKGKNKSPKPIQEHVSHTDAMKDALDNLDATLEKRKAVVLIKEPATAQEYTAMMLEIDAIEFDENGVPSYKFYEDVFDDTLNPPKYVRTPVEKETVYTRLRTADDPAYSDGDDAKFVENHNQFAASAATVSDDTEELDEEQSELDDAIKIIIDKTGLGSEIHFTEEEKEKMTLAREIHLVEVENLDLSTVNTVSSTRSFQDEIRAHHLSSTMKQIAFPSSGFMADISGLTYGEMTDIAMSLNGVTFDRYNKRFSILYNHMSNFSSGKIKSYDDFLKNISILDMTMAMYGAYVATYPDIQTLPMRCGNKSCPKPAYEWKFETAGVFNTKKTDPQFIKSMRDIYVTPPTKYDELWDNAIVRKSKNIKLPFSGYIVEIGLISAYDYLYNVVPLTNDETFKKLFEDDVNDTYKSSITLLMCVKSIKIPNEDGTGYIEYTSNKDLLDILYYINADEMRLITALVERIMNAYTPVFTINNVVCPTCHTKTAEIQTNMEELVFQNHQRLFNLNIDVESVLGF